MSAFDDVLAEPRSWRDDERPWYFDDDPPHHDPIREDADHEADTSTCPTCWGEGAVRDPGSRRRYKTCQTCGGSGARYDTEGNAA